MAQEQLNQSAARLWFWREHVGFPKEDHTGFGVRRAGASLLCHDGLEAPVWQRAKRSGAAALQFIDTTC